MRYIPYIGVGRMHGMVKCDRWRYKSSILSMRKESYERGTVP